MTRKSPANSRSLDIVLDAAPDTGQEAVDSSGQLTSQTTTPSFGAWLRQRKFWLIIGTVFLVIITISFYQSLNSSNYSSLKLSLDNPAPDGAMAVGQVLGQRGVNVVATDNLVDTKAQIAQLGASDTTLVLIDPDNFLDNNQAQELAQAGVRIVAIAPGPLKLPALTSEVVSAGAAQPGSVSENSPVPAGCTNPDAQAAQQVVPGFSRLYAGPTVCFGDTAQDEPVGMMAQSADGSFTALGSTTFLSNDQLATEGNAALAFRLLGRDANLIWYLPSAKDLLSSGPFTPQLSDLQPSWLAPVTFWLAIVALLAIFWKGRRHGPLVEEPLPVIVKAAETAAGRARLYQDGRAAGRAAENLRAAVFARLARRYRLGIGAGREAVVLATIRHTDLAETEIREILLHTTPSTEAQLLAWSQQLAALERETERDH